MESVTNFRRHILTYDQPECEQYIKPSVPRYYSNFYDWRKAFFPTPLCKKYQNIFFPKQKPPRQPIPVLLRIIMILIAVFLIVSYFQKKK